MKLEEIHVNKYFSLVLNFYLQGGHAGCLDKINNIPFLIIRNDDTLFNFSMLNKEMLSLKKKVFECILIHIGSKIGKDNIFLL